MLKKELLQRLGDLQADIDNSNNANNADSKDSNNNENEYREKLRNMEDDLHTAQGENNKRVNETTQFLTMKKLMQNQTVKIKDLRRKLQKYEPDDCKGDEDF